MRPSRYLGYDRDHFGPHLLSKEMVEIAQSQLRCPAFLNPYKARFL